MTRFVRVQDQCATYNVPTKEEYEDYRGKVNKILGELQARITTIEHISPEEEEPEVYAELIENIDMKKLKLTGTKEQHQLLISRVGHIPLKHIHGNALVSLALDCGLSVKKVD